MTNHPRSPRAKFRVGQVVNVSDIAYEKIVSIEHSDGRCDWLVMSNGNRRANSGIKPLTKKEAGR